MRGQKKKKKKISTLRINARNSNKAPTSTFPLQHRFANRTLFSYPCRSAVDINCQVCGGGRKIKRAQLSPRHPIAAMSLKRMLCSAVLLHYQQTDNLFDSASRESAAMCCACYTLLPISINSFLLVIAACASAFLPSCSKSRTGGARPSAAFAPTHFAKEDDKKKKKCCGDN